MTARPVLAPDGTWYPSIKAAAVAHNTDKDVMRMRIVRRTNGWKFAGEADTIIGRVFELVQTAGSHGATLGEVAKLLHGDSFSESELSTVSSSMTRLRHAGRIEPNGQSRRTGKQRNTSTVYVAIATEAPAPREPDAHVGNIRRAYKPPRVVPIERTVAVLPESETPQELARYADKLRRDWPVVPLRGGKWLVDDVEVAAADLVALARGDVRLRQLREGGVG